jgi:hypothetical protein
LGRPSSSCRTNQVCALRSPIEEELRRAEARIRGEPHL